MDFNGRTYLTLQQVCEMWGHNSDYVLNNLAYQALIYYRGDALPSNWETRNSDCSSKYIEGLFWIKSDEVYPFLKDLINGNLFSDELPIDELIPHYFLTGSRLYVGTHRNDPAGVDDFLPVDDYLEPKPIVITQSTPIYFWIETVSDYSERKGINQPVDKNSVPTDVVIAKLKQEELKQAEFNKLRNMPLWSEDELKNLCCGLIPMRGRVNFDALNKAGETIMRAIIAKHLRCIEPSDATSEDRMYGHARFFFPEEAIKWAKPLFPDLPFEPLLSDKDKISNQEATVQEATNEHDSISTLQAIGIMAELLAKCENGYQYRKGDNNAPNAKAIGDAVARKARVYFGNDVRGFDSFHKKISKGLKELEKK